MVASKEHIRTHLCTILNIDPAQVTFVRDEQDEWVVILLQPEQIEWACRENSRVVRQAAMDLGIDIEFSAA